MQVTQVICSHPTAGPSTARCPPEVDLSCSWNLFLQVSPASAELALQLEVLPYNLLAQQTKRSQSCSWQLLTKKSSGIGLWVPSLLQQTAPVFALTAFPAPVPWISYCPWQVEAAEGISLSPQPAWHRQGYFLTQLSFYCPALHTHKNRVKTIN